MTQLASPEVTTAFSFTKTEATFAKAINPVKNEKGEIVSADRMPIPKFEYQFSISLMQTELHEEIVQALIIKQVKEMVQADERLKNCTSAEYKTTLEALIREVTSQSLWDSLLGEDKGGVFGLAKFKAWVGELFTKVKATYKEQTGKDLDKQLASVYVSAFAQGQSMPGTVKTQILDWAEKFEATDDVSIKAIEWLAKTPQAKPAIPDSLI